MHIAACRQWRAETDISKSWKMKSKQFAWLHMTWIKICCFVGGEGLIKLALLKTWPQREEFFTFSRNPASVELCNEQGDVFFQQAGACLAARMLAQISLSWSALDKNTESLPGLEVQFVAVVDLFTSHWREASTFSLGNWEYQSLKKRQYSESSWFKWKNTMTANAGSKRWGMSVCKGKKEIGTEGGNTIKARCGRMRQKKEKLKISGHSEIFKMYSAHSYIISVILLNFKSACMNMY